MVLSDGLWRRAFQADPRVVGTTILLYKQPFTVIGVAPAPFHGTEQCVWPDFYLPLLNYFDADHLHSRTDIAMSVLGRLKPGVTPRQATANLDAIAAQLAREYPQTDSGQPLRLIRPGLYGDTGDTVRGFLYSAGGLALLVLLAACANLASLSRRARGGPQTRTGAPRRAGGRAGGGWCASF